MRLGMPNMSFFKKKTYQYIWNTRGYVKDQRKQNELNMKKINK